MIQETIFKVGCQTIFRRAMFSELSGILNTQVGSIILWAVCPSIVTTVRHEYVVSEGLHPCKSPGDSPLIMSNDSL